MNVVANERVICFDVDETLILWEKQREALAARVDIKCPYNGDLLTLGVHEPHVKLLKNHLARGTQVIVWSQGGYQWAEAVLKALGFDSRLKDPVMGACNLLVMSKPFEYVDDLPIEAWLKNRLYLAPDSAWGATGGRSPDDLTRVK